MTSNGKNEPVLFSGDDSVLEMFQTAALLLGNREEAVAAVEKAVAATHTDPCAEPEKARSEGRELLVRVALERAVALSPGAFKPAALSFGTEMCIDTEDLESAGVTADQVTQIVSGSGTARLREWLERLAPESRVIFVLRAMLGQDNAAIAAELGRTLGRAEWTAQQVGQVFRGALCSLASSLVHAPSAS